ncbi:hypothetical protein HJC23_000016 [Cyclotella cryptica]|uniref:Uncharacterized protein n=1 Tax=Cyclotella cryptica TaxID=29204 RepID=A0ABD3PAV9_9STRA
MKKGSLLLSKEAGRMPPLWKGGEDNIQQSTIVTVQETIQQISQLKREKRWKEADRLKTILLQNYSIQIFSRKDGTVGWAALEESDKPPTRTITWSLLDKSDESSSSISSCTDVPLIIATVNLPHYRSRLAETLDCLPSPQKGDGTRFHPIHCIDMLRLVDCPTIGVNRIVFEGWRQILLPTIMSMFERTSSSDRGSIVFVAEDDVRLCSHSPGKIREVCTNVFRDNPELQILSLGYRYATKKPSRRQRRRAKRVSGVLSDDFKSNSVEMSCDSGKSTGCKSTLLNHLKSGGGIHGATFLAIRYPNGVTALLDAMEKIAFGKRSHFDQLLFHSTLHDIEIALSVPPLAGWAEVEETLTSVGSGYRREGGGRLGYCPFYDLDDGIHWIRRKISSK